MTAEASAGIDRAKVLETLDRALWEVDHKRLHGAEMGDLIESLGVGSVAMLEVIGLLEEMHRIRLPDERLERVSTIGDLVSEVQRAAASRDGSRR